MSGAVRSWDELLDAGVTASEAAAARGVTKSAAAIAASRRGRQWKNALFKTTDEDIRKVAKRSLPVDQAAEILGVSPKTVYTRVTSMRGIVIHGKRLWTQKALRMAQAAEMEAARQEKEERAARAVAERAAQKAAKAERRERGQKSGIRFSASPAAIERYLAKGAQPRRYAS